MRIGVVCYPTYGGSGAVATMHEARASNRLSRAAVETLAVVAYRQPITRAEIEAIRGVACGEVLRTLLERRLVAIAGRAEEVGTRDRLTDGELAARQAGTPRAAF